MRAWPSPAPPRANPSPQPSPASAGEGFLCAASERMHGSMADAAPQLQAEIPAYSHQQIVRVITGIMLCIFLASLDQTVIIPAVPAIAADLNAFGHLSWIVTAYLLTSTAATPIIALAVTGVVLLAALAWFERRAPEAILPPRLFGNRHVPARGAHRLL